MTEREKQKYISAICDAIGTEKLTHFAKRAGISAGNLSRIRKGQIAQPQILRKIAAASENVTYEELMQVAGFTSNMLADCEVRSYRRGLIRVPVIDDVQLLNEPLIDNNTLPYEELYATSLNERNHYVYYVAGDDAVVPEGSRVLVDLSKKPQDGDIILLSHEGHAMLRRMTRNGYTYFYYGNDIHRYPMTPVKRSQIEIYGVAIRASIDL